MARRLALNSERGFTIIELMVATLILAIGILGTVAMIDTSNANTSKTKAREGATNLGRAVLEAARAVSYKDLSVSSIEDELAKHPGLVDSNPAKPGYQITSRNFTYDITIGVCSLDDPKDRLGDHDEAIDFCSDSEVAAAGATTKDRNPDDYRRVSISMAWKDPTAVSATTKQTGVITNPVGGLGPSIVALNIAGGATTITSNVATASFTASTSVSAAYVNWSIDGADKGKANNGPVNWAFDWNLNETKADGSLRYPDCTYLVQAEAFDDKDRSGAPKALTVTLNRSRPSAPTRFAGGRNLNGNYVDLEWAKNPECDVVGYKVYRGTSPASITTPVPDCDNGPNDFDCIDTTAPAPVAGTTLYYKVVALDKDASQVVQPGTASTPLAVVEGNSSPSSPAGFAACVGGSPGCNDIDGNPAQAGSAALSWNSSTDPNGDSILYYRVYRGGNTYGDRYDVQFPVAGKPLVFVDSKPAAGANTYYVSAVDSKYGESAPVGPVTVTP